MPQDCRPALGLAPAAINSLRSFPKGLQAIAGSSGRAPDQEGTNQLKGICIGWGAIRASQGAWIAVQAAFGLALAKLDRLQHQPTVPFSATQTMGRKPKVEAIQLKRAQRV